MISHLKLVCIPHFRRSNLLKDARNAAEAKALVKDVKNEVGVQKVMAHVLVDDDDDEFRKNRVLGNVQKMEGTNHFHECH